jgi:hypothetical protein
MKLVAFRWVEETKTIFHWEYFPFSPLLFSMSSAAMLATWRSGASCRASLYTS